MSADDGERGRWIGQSVGGKYKIERRIAVGGMASVYEATNRWTERRVAIRLVEQSGDRTNGRVRRALREARIVARIVHPNVVDVLDMGRDESTGALFVVQELLRGRELGAELSRRPGGTLEAAECVAWLTPIAEALEEAHAQQIVHRGLTTGSVFLARSAVSIVPKLIDFRHARVGTIDPRDDVWSVGALFYRCLTGTAPQPDGGPLVPVDHRAEVPTELATIVHRALDRDPGRRFPSMTALVDALGRTSLHRCTVPPNSTIRPIVTSRVRFGFVMPPPGELRDAITAIARRVKVRVAPVLFDRHAAVVDALAEGVIDLAWLSPVAYVRAARIGAVRAVLTATGGVQRSYSAALVVRAEERPRELSELVGARAAWVHPSSAAGYLIPRRMLRAASLEPDRVLRGQSFLGSREQVVRALLAGEVDVGAIGVHPDEVHDERLRIVVSSSEPIPGDAICASTHLDETRAQELVRRFVESVTVPELSLALRVVSRGAALVAADPSHYRELDAALEEDLAAGRGTPSSAVV